MTIARKIMQYLGAVRDLKGRGEISMTTPLIETGVLDSFSVLELMTFLEKEFSIKMEADDLKLENVATAINIEALVLSKLGRDGREDAAK